MDLKGRDSIKSCNVEFENGYAEDAAVRANIKLRD